MMRVHEGIDPKPLPMLRPQPRPAPAPAPAPQDQQRRAPVASDNPIENILRSIFGGN
jgi:hypothetical protein